VSREAVIIAHGLWMSGLETHLLRKRVAEITGFETHAFSYRSTQDNVGIHVGDLLRFAAGLDAETLHFVGHSLGGLLTVMALQRQLPANAGRVVALAAPLTGCAAGAGLTQWPAGAWLVGSVLREVLGTLPLPAWERPVPLGVIAGTLGHGLGHFFAHLPMPHDGTIAVAETRLPGIADHLEVAVSHTGMLFSERVAAQVAHFLQDGRFRR
jgi:pimeloyl-ACP methyl ester carboxylesterase